MTFTAAVVGETRVIVRLDNIEMTPLKLLFVDGGKGGKGGKQSDANAVIAAPEDEPAERKVPPLHQLKRMASVSVMPDFVDSDVIE